MDRQPLLHQQHNNDDGSNTVAITMEKDSAANTRSLKERHSIQRSLGFKNMVIYVLLFVNLLLCSKLFSTWSSGSNNKNNVGAFNAAGASCDSSTLGEGEGGEHEGSDASTPEFWIKMALIVFLVLIGGVFAGKCSPFSYCVLLLVLTSSFVLGWRGVCFFSLMSLEGSSLTVVAFHYPFNLCPHESFSLHRVSFSSLFSFSPCTLFNYYPVPPFFAFCFSMALYLLFSLFGPCVTALFSSFNNAGLPLLHILLLFLLLSLLFLLLLLLGLNMIPDLCRIDDWSDGLGRDEPSSVDGFRHANGTSSCRDGVQVAVTRKALGLG